LLQAEDDPLYVWMSLPISWFVLAPWWILWRSTYNWGHQCVC